MNRDERRVIERYAYCLCLHVRPGTIFIGVINLAGSLLCGLLYMVALGYHQSSDDIAGHRHFDPHRRTSQSSLAVVIYMMCATVSGMLLYGVVKSRPSYLMPFFWIQLCDFFFSLPTFLTSLYATPGYSPPHWDYTASGAAAPGTVHGPNSNVLDVKRIWPNANSATIYTSSLLFSAAILLFKGYFLCVVWKCYRYLKMKEMILPLHLQHPYATGTDIVIPPGFLSPMANPPPAAAFVAPPDYETATKSNSPPDYEAACRAAIDESLKEPVPASPSGSGTGTGLQNAEAVVVVTADPQSTVATTNGVSVASADQGIPGRNMV